MTIEERPDQRPATTDTWAAPLEGEDGEAALLRPLLRQTMLERLPLALAYDASVHGWSAEAFHACLDGQGAALLVAESEAGAQSLLEWHLLPSEAFFLQVPSLEGIIRKAGSATAIGETPSAPSFSLEIRLVGQSS